MLHYALLALVVACAFTTKGITGFGNTLVMSPLFSLLSVPMGTTTPVDLLFSLPTNAYITWKERRSLNLRVALPLAAMMIIGILPGAFFLKLGDDWALKALCGLTTFALAFDIYFRNRPRRRPARPASKSALFVIGIASGVFSGLFSIGAFLVSYVNRTTNDPHKFRADLCCVFFLENAFRLGLYAVLGILSGEAFLLALKLSPFVVAGMFLGLWLHKHMSQAMVTRAMVILIAASGLVLFVRSVFFH